WIRVRTEDGRFTEETVPAGQVREGVSNGPFVLTIGNAGGVSFELNGRVLPALGPSGAVISRLRLPPHQRSSGRLSVSTSAHAGAVRETSSALSPQPPST